MTSPSPSRPPPDPDGLPDERPRPGTVWVWVAGLGISAAIHVAFLFIYPILMARITPDPAPPAPPGQAIRPSGMEVLEVAELPEPDAQEPVEIPEDPEEEPEPERAEPTTEPTPTEPAPEGGGEEPRSAAEILRPPTSGDPRIWSPVDSTLARLTDEQRAKLRFLWRLEALNDSAMTEAERARAAREWVYTDEEGKKWGVSPGQLHLGDVTVPLPFNFSAPASARDYLEEWLWRDVQAGAETSIIRDTWEERIEAIRERRDAERADTSGVRRRRP